MSPYFHSDSVIMMIHKAAVLLLCVVCCVYSRVLITSSGSSLQIDLLKNDGAKLKLSVGNDTKLTGHIGRNLSVNETECGKNFCFYTGSNDTLLQIYALDNTFMVQWYTSNPKYEKTIFSDCYHLNSSNTSWYGGPEVLVTEWPIEKLKLKNRPFIASKLDNGAVVEPYWLNSKGAAISIDYQVPLFVDQNNEQNDTVCFKSEIKAPYGRNDSVLTYTLLAKNNSREAHIFATNTFISRPRSLPNYKMIKEPIWTTWGKYKADINDSSVIEFLKTIYKHNFTKGQIEIDDKWEVCYGDQTFNTNARFSKINETVATIHKYGFRATLWTHPFVNTDCQIPVAEGKRKGFFVNSTLGDPVTSWWNGNSSYVIDFTNENATKWFVDRLLKLHNDSGIDGFKCDAGESDWLPEKPIFKAQRNAAPNAFTYWYLNACNQLGNLVEVRSGYGTQNLPVFVRMLDKDSVWGRNNGLKAIVHSLLQFNMIGYTFVLPDLVGGNGYNGTVPSPELLVRWTQANALMPAIQFSYLPWELEKAKFNTTEIVRKFVDLHARYSDLIIEAMVNSTRYGTPVNPPIWWVDPTDPIALKVDDEFLVGEKILVAPVLDEGAVSRDIYLPKGRWRDGNNGTIYGGRRTLRNYSAPIDVLPYFHRL